MNTVLAAVDFSPATVAVASAAIALARPVHARVVFLHVTPPPALVRDILPVVDSVEQRARALAKAAEQNLSELQQLYHHSDSPLENFVCSGPAAATIVEQAQRLGAQYIVLGSHGQTAAREILVGSTASNVIKHASCPVLVIPPHLPAGELSIVAWHEPRSVWS
jgi:nucleotide-binding universal stress UspA family protein